MLTVLTWKVEDLFRRERPADAAAQVTYRRKVMNLAAAICDSGAEIVALQEIACLNALDDLLAELGGDWQHKASDPDERGTRTVWLARSRQTEDSVGECQQARRLNEETLSRCRSILGDDHPDTLGFASDLAFNLRALGQLEEARELDEDTLDRRRSMLGDDHPDTLASASNLAVSLHALGELERARELNEDTLCRRRHVLGDRHPATRRSVRLLAADLTALGDVQRAATLLAELELDP